jgi:hypothetical protein
MPALHSRRRLQPPRWKPRVCAKLPYNVPRKPIVCKRLFGGFSWRVVTVCQHSWMRRTAPALFLAVGCCLKYGRVATSTYPLTRCRTIALGGRLKREPIDGSFPFGGGPIAGRWPEGALGARAKWKGKWNEGSSSIRSAVRVPEYVT